MLPAVPRFLTAAVVSSVLLAGMAPAVFAAPPVVPDVTQPGTVQAGVDEAAQYVVRYSPGTDVAGKARFLRGKGIGVGREFSQAVRAAVVTLTPAEAAVLASSPQVEAVERDTVMSISATQQPAPWGLDRIDQRTQPLSGSYTTTATGAGVSAYVVDSGILASHTDFGGRVTQGWSAVSDGRGTSDCNGHGTHVAGTVAGATYGVAKSATLVPVRVFGCTGSGYTSDVIAGLDWIAGHHTAGAPAVVNLSLGGAASSTVDAALQGVINDGVTAVAAAGNSSADACTASPARLPAALTVAASDSSDRQASFSNFGTCVDLYAPGVSIMSASHTSNTSTATLSGTSMAAPHAAGAAVLLLSQQPSLTPAQVTSTLNSTATTATVTSASAGTPNRLLYTAAPTPEPAASEPAPSVNGPIRTAWVNSGAENGVLGHPTNAEICGLRDNGCYQSFQRGEILWSAATGAQISRNGGIRTAYRAAGTENGVLGYPTSAEICGLRDNGCSQSFQRGEILWSATTGVHVSRQGGIRATYRAAGAENGVLGYPTSPEICGLKDGGCYQSFQRGEILWSATTGAHVSRQGAIRNAYRAAGAENGVLGYPRSPEICGLRDNGCYQSFQNGEILWSAATNAHSTVTGPIRTNYRNQGAENSALGYPVTTQTCPSTTQCTQTFQTGTLTWTPTTGVQMVRR